MVAPSQKGECLDYIIDKFDVSRARVCKIVNCSRTRFYYKKKMPVKDQSIKEAIESVMGSTRKGRKKIIRLVKKQHPHLSASKIRRVYVKKVFPF